MARTSGLSAAVLLLAAGAALAHQGVKDPAVKARMDAMEVIGKNTKLLGHMAKGQTAFDPGAVRTAAERIALEAERTPVLFATKANDPLSEARAEIWTNFDDFTRKSMALRDAALAAATISSEDELRPALASLGSACKACHADYRE